MRINLIWLYRFFKMAFFLLNRYFSQLSPSQISSLSKAFEADFRLFGYSPDEPL